MGFIDRTLVCPVAGDPAAASSNFALIQNALDTVGNVTIATVGDCYINDRLTIREGNALHTIPGSSLKMASGINKALLVTMSRFSAWTDVTVAWTAGPLAVVTWASHAMAVGDTMTLQGASVFDWWDNFVVTAVIDANSFEVMCPFLPTASPVGAVSSLNPGGTLRAKRLLRNIDVDVALDYNFSENPGGSGIDSNRMVADFSFIADSSVKIRGKGQHKYGLLLCGARNVEADCEIIGLGNSDTAKGYAPLSNVIIRAKGVAPEDCVSSQGREGDTFLNYQPAFGNIRGLTFDLCEGVLTTAGSGPLVIYSDGYFIQEGIVVRKCDLKSKAPNVPAMSIKASTIAGQPAPKPVRDITIADTILSADKCTPLEVNVGVSKLTLTGGIITPPAQFRNDGSSVNRIIRAFGTAPIDELVIENKNFDLGVWPLSRSYIYETAGNPHSVIVFNKVRIRGSSALRVLLLSGSATVRTVVFQDCDIAGIDGLVEIATGQAVIPEVVITRGSHDVLFGVNAKQSAKVVLDGPRFNNASNGIVRGENSGTVVELTGHAQLDGTSSLWVPLTSATISPKDDRIRLDVSATGVNKAQGNKCFNTNAALGTLGVAGPVIADASNWHLQTDPTKIY